MPYMPEPTAEPSKEEVEKMPGLVLLEFGATWCPHCQAAQSMLKAELGKRANVKHLKIEDGRGRPLGRNYRVKLWPNLVFLRDGQVLSQLARPSDAELQETFKQFDATE
ncbi:MAG: thioredoxin family protein [Pirellulales bacterium]